MMRIAKSFYCPDLVSRDDALVIEETLEKASALDTVEADHVLHRVHAITFNEEGMRDVETLLGEAGFPPESSEELTSETSQNRFYAG